MDTYRTLRKIVDRPAKSMKYDYGHLMIIGGSKYYAGAVALCASAAYVSGVDLVTVCAPQRAADTIVCNNPSIVSYPLCGDYVSARHYAEIVDVVKRKVSAIVVGVGMGRSARSFSLIRKLHSNIHMPFIFDADSLHGLEGMRLRRHDVLMPNVREFEYLYSGAPCSETSVRALSKKMGCVVFSKGSVDYISDGNKVRAVSDMTGKCMYLAKGGTGDIVAGLCGGLIAEGIDSYEACIISARAMKSAGARIGADYGPFYNPIDVVDYVRKSLLQIIRTPSR